MIHRCRPDSNLDCLRSPSPGEPIADTLAELLCLNADQSIHWTPSAREAVVWFLGAAGLSAGDEVLMPALMCPVVADVVADIGATVAVYSLSPDRFQPDVASCEDLVSKQTKAVIVPHLYGTPADLHAFRELCDRHGLLMIEDCAPCVSGHDVGQVGDCAVLSFKFDKPIGLGWGGAVILNGPMREKLGSPQFPVLSGAQDQAVAASFLLQLAWTSHRHYNAPLSMEAALGRLLHDTALTAAILDAFRQGADESELVALCPPPIARSTMLPRAVRPLARLVKKYAFPAKHPSGLSSSALDGRKLRPDGSAMKMLAASAKDSCRVDHALHRAAIAGTYQQHLDTNQYAVPPSSKNDDVAFWLRFPISHRSPPHDIASRLDWVSKQTGLEVGAFNWPIPIHQTPRFRHIRTADDIQTTQRAVAGLVNLPVHAEVTESDARKLSLALNRL